jgi:hypothetical protein
MRWLGCALLLLLGCGARPPSCPNLLPAAHLVEGFCDGGVGYCLFDHPVPF